MSQSARFVYVTICDGQVSHNHAHFVFRFLNTSECFPRNWHQRAMRARVLQEEGWMDQEEVENGARNGVIHNQLSEEDTQEIIVHPKFALLNSRKYFVDCNDTNENCGSDFWEIEKALF